MTKEQIDEIALRVQTETTRAVGMPTHDCTTAVWADYYTRALFAELARASEPVEIIWPEYHEEGMGCGLEDRNITDRYEAMRHGWDCAIERCAEAIPETLFEHPPLQQPDLVAEIERLNSLSVTNIMLDVVPGDGSGQEVYAKSVDDVVAALTRLGEKAEDLFSTEIRLESYIKQIDELRQQLSAAQVEISQRITVDEMNAEIDSASKAVAEHYEKQLSAAQADSDGFLMALEVLMKWQVKNVHIWSNPAYDYAVEAIAAHKARQAKCDPTLTQCPRCENDISKCGGAYKTHQGKEES